MIKKKYNVKTRRAKSDKTIKDFMLSLADGSMLKVNSAIFYSDTDGEPVSLVHLYNPQNVNQMLIMAYPKRSQ